MFQNVCVPMKLDAFRLNLSSCDGPSRLAPITQPNYSLLDVSKSIHHDVLDHIDLHDTARGPQHSDRVTNLATGIPRRNRLGIYLHWILPKFYRTGIAATQSAESTIADKRKWHGHPAASPTRGGAGIIDSQSPTFRPIPNRWIVIRYLRSIFPANADIPTYQAFVVESDRLQNFDDLGPDVDLEIDVSPFINPDSDKQGEAFIGHKTPLNEWQEDSPAEKKRVPISVLSSANPLFADYQLHNTNVLSIVDNFAYGQNQYLQKATADYFVVGWHSDPADDPFHFQSQSPQPTFADRLNSCMMELADCTPTDSFDPKQWLKGSLSSRNVRVALHGSIYGVEWAMDRLPPHVPANSGAELVNQAVPISVGATPLDALVAIAHAHNTNPNAGERSIERDILSLHTLVIKSEDDVDSQLEAADILYDQNFTPSDGGQQWHISATPRQSGTGGSGALGSQRPVQPTERELLKLEEINAYQMSFDLHKREAKWLQWALWAEWWKYVSVKTKPISPGELRGKVSKITQDLGLLIHSMDTLRLEIKRLKQARWEPAAGPKFYMAKDPSILLAGLENGWPADYVDLLKVRIDQQLVSPAQAGFLYLEQDDPHELRGMLRGKVPIALRDTIDNLVSEFNLINPYKQQPLPSPRDIMAQIGRYPRLQPSNLPLYYDRESRTNSPSDEAGLEKWRNRWNDTQAWFPLFVEWQVEYDHVEAQKWTVAERGAYGPPNLRYRIKDNYLRETNDIRTISGRAMVSPKPLHSLKNNLGLLFKSASEDKSGAMAELDKLKFIALSMSDFTDNLLTIHQGTHVKPHVRAPGCMPVPMTAAVNASSAIMTQSDLALMGSETRGTPFGDSINFADATISPFIPVTHGRFRFTKLNIVDKFGQVISAIDPAPGPHRPLCPYISEIYQRDDDRPGSASPDDAQWMQIGPRINQGSRLNSHFVVWDEVRRGWKPATEYDNPIWGWVVVDFVGFGIQIFLPDGRFYREIRMGGPVGTSQGRAWLPFEPPGQGQESIPAQLKQLMMKLRDPAYLEAIFCIVSNSLQHMKSPPNQYAHYFPAIVGKPFALVNAGFSLELSHPPCENQSTTVNKDAVTAPPLESYGFQVKLGDRDRIHDGLVLYFESKPAPPHEIDTGRIFTYFPEQDGGNSNSILIKPSNYPRFTPYFMRSCGRTPTELVGEYKSRLQVFGILADPFIAVHAYSGILPVRELKLPPWAVEQSLKNITAFFKLGPLITPHDVPPYDPQHVLGKGSDSTMGTSSDSRKPQSHAVLIPSIATADWDWLQPHVVNTSSGRTTHFNALSVACPDSRVRFEPTPYTAIEGYLHLKRPITGPKVEDDKIVSTIVA